MANESFSFEVSYHQDDDNPAPGEITFTYAINAGTPVSETLPASGRLDTVGALVIAEGFTVVLSPGNPDPRNDFDVVVECTRTSKDAMRVRLVFIGYRGPNSNFPYYSEFAPVLEKIIEDVKLDFQGG